MNASPVETPAANGTSVAPRSRSTACTARPASSGCATGTPNAAISRIPLSPPVHCSTSPPIRVTRSVAVPTNASSSAVPVAGIERNTVVIRRCSSGGGDPAATREAVTGCRVRAAQAGRSPAGWSATSGPRATRSTVTSPGAARSAAATARSSPSPRWTMTCRDSAAHTSDVTSPPDTPTRTLSSTGPARLSVPEASATSATTSSAASIASSQPANATVIASPPKARASPPCAATMSIEPPITRRTMAPSSSVPAVPCRASRSERPVNPAMSRKMVTRSRVRCCERLSSGVNATRGR